MKIVAQEGTALLLDAAGTLLHPSEPVARTYARAAKDFGITLDEREVSRLFGDAMISARQLRKGSSDWRSFWAEVIRRSTGIESETLLDRLMFHFSSPEAWTLTPGALECCQAVKRKGMRTGLVSNWDTRLRPLLTAMGAASAFDTLVISGEELIEKPDPRLFSIACQRLDVTPGQALHVGDSPSEDVRSARRAGCHALLWGRDVTSFDELQRRLGIESGSTHGS